MFRNYRAYRGEEALPAMLPTPPPFSSSTNSTNFTNCGRWFPYKNSSDFYHNLFMVIVILVSALTGLPAINFAIRCLRRRRQPPLDLPDTADQVPKPPLFMEATPTMPFSSELRLSGVGDECAICLSKFVSGEMLRVLPKCKHGFHEKCIEKWLVSACSCPTCRASLLIPSLPAKKMAGRSEVELPQNGMVEP